ncbi:cuticle protein 16.5-like [Drosophila persimilis]|uniref:cuticle protein 16.5-like n=1 Tax=Drosophila persimilis TaxID=7234 RepID=UPI000F09497C|nr:cuticle protein 16.5-like [Drosophila persimilis]
MFKFAAVILAVLACASAKPGFLSAPLAYTAPAAIVAAPGPVVTATSSQVFARNYNGIAAAPVIAPVAAPLAAPVIAKYAAAPLAAPVIAKYAAAPLATPLAYHSAPLAYSSSLASPLGYSAPLTYNTYGALHAPAPVLF